MGFQDQPRTNPRTIANHIGPTHSIAFTAAAPNPTGGGSIYTERFKSVLTSIYPHLGAAVGSSTMQNSRELNLSATNDENDDNNTCGEESAAADDDENNTCGEESVADDDENNIVSKNLLHKLTRIFLLKSEQRCIDKSANQGLGFTDSRLAAAHFHPNFAAMAFSYCQALGKPSSRPTSRRMLKNKEAIN
jgi:hypothetical protein